MISDIKKQEILTVKSMLDTYNSNITTTNDEILAIDEKYKAIIESEKKGLKAKLSELKSQKKPWEKMFNSFDEASVKEVLGDNYNADISVEAAPETESDLAASEEQIKDTLFPENNEYGEKPEPSHSAEDAVAKEEEPESAELKNDEASQEVEKPNKPENEELESKEEESTQSDNNGDGENKPEPDESLVSPKDNDGLNWGEFDVAGQGGQVEPIKIDETSEFNSDDWPDYIQEWK